MPTFSNFITLYPDKRYTDNVGANSFFNNLCDPKIVGSMIFNVSQGLPAVEALPQSLIEAFYSDPAFPLSESCNHPYIGKMICYIMNLYGFIPLKKKNIQKNNSISVIFSFGHTYKKK